MSVHEARIIHMTKKRVSENEEHEGQVSSISIMKLLG